jgi:hypothetical protein
MKRWKVIIELQNKTQEVIIEGSSYSDAYVKAEIKYPDCKIKSVSEIRPK